MTDFLDDEIRREGGATLTDDPDDRGGLTKFGLSQRANPDLDIAHLDYTTAKARFQERYVDGPGFSQLAPSKLRDQLVDFGITSGPAVATKKLQQILDVPDDGVFGPVTQAALITHADSQGLNNRLLAKRLQMIADLVAKNPSQVKFLRGWVKRALEFLW